MRANSKANDLRRVPQQSTTHGPDFFARLVSVFSQKGFLNKYVNDAMREKLRTTSAPTPPSLT